MGCEMMFEFGKAATLEEKKWAVSLREIWFNINFHKLVWNKAQTGLGLLLAEAGCFFYHLLDQCSIFF